MSNTSNFNPTSTNPADPWARHIENTYGGRSMADVSKYWDISGQRRTMGAASRAPGGNWGYNTGSGSVRLRGMGGGTPSNPGGYNYATLSNIARFPGQVADMNRSHQARLDTARKVRLRELEYQKQFGSSQPVAASDDGDPRKNPAWAFASRAGKRIGRGIANSPVGDAARQKIGVPVANFAARQLQKLEDRRNPQAADDSDYDVDDPFQ